MSCELSWDADRVFRALDGDLGDDAQTAAETHVARCDACEETVRARARARAAWRAGIDRDDAMARAESEERLTDAWRAPPRRRPIAIPIAAAAAIAACVALGLGLHARTASTGAPAIAHGRAPPIASAHAPAASPSAEARAAEAPPVMRVVATSPCPDCRAGASALEPGSSLETERAVAVPPGARLTLGFAVPGGLVDPAIGADVEGPALASVVDGGAISLERGRARMRGVRDVVVLVPGGRVATSGGAATYTVRVDDRGAARVVVEAGRVAVTPRGAREPVEVDAGASIEIDARGASVTERPAAAAKAAEEPAAAAPAAVADAPAAPATPRAAPASATPDEVLAGARARSREGDVDGARADLERLAASSDARIARRASFTLAEIELANGAQPKARERLGALLACPDASLGADAATLLARSFPAPSDRAAAWGRYLATRPPSPHRERAMLERADALLDARRAVEADALLEELRRSTLDAGQKRQLDRLLFKAREVR